MPSEVSFDRLASADLEVGAIYKGGSRGNYGDDPIAKLMGCGNQGGFRHTGTAGAWKLVPLFTTFAEQDWPDNLNPTTGLFTYYGDNKEPGCDLHETPKGGNALLREVFADLWVRPHRRDRIPPFFIFSKAGSGRDVRFEGLAAPGAPTLSESEDLVAIWKTHNMRRFQNYRSIFTILDVEKIHRAWIDDRLQGRTSEPTAPAVWTQWIDEGIYIPKRH